MKFKLEVCLLTAAIALFVLSSVFYSYQVDNNQTQNMYTSNLIEATSAATTSFPYQAYAISSMGFGSILMIVASISYQKRSKELEKIVK